MLQIDNHEEKALSVIIPYLLQFPELYGLAQNSGKRAQNIEDVAWELLWNLDIDTANGVWLDYLGKKVGQSRTYSPTVEGAFTFGGTTAEGFGKGKFLSSALSGTNTKIARSDANFKNAIRAKIIENNTDCSIDELINSCKLLYNASLVIVNENYPARISSIYIYGSSLIQSSNANTEIKKMIPAGVSLGTVYFQNVYNLFKNNAFISYTSDYIIPPTDDFVLSFSFNPDTLTSSNIYLLSESSSFSQESSLSIHYNNTDGIVFSSTPDIYVDGNGVNYVDGNGTPYYSNEGSIYLSGGTVNTNEENTVRIVKSSALVDSNDIDVIDSNGILIDTTNTGYQLYVNDILVDTLISDENIGGASNNLYLGVSNNNYYNSSSINNLYIYNSDINTTILNDTLKTKTNFGINSGVLFL